MTDELRIDQQLDASAARSAGGTERLVLDIRDGQTLELEGAVVERLACSFDRLTLRSIGLLAIGAEQLKQMAESLSHRLSYLLEPIRPLEFDDEACVVQMRSVPPSRDEAGTTYYELVVSRGQIELCRFNKTPGQPRSLRSATLTREAFRRLVQDLSAAAG